MQTCCSSSRARLVRTPQQSTWTCGRCAMTGNATGEVVQLGLPWLALLAPGLAADGWPSSNGVTWVSFSASLCPRGSVHVPLSVIPVIRKGDTSDQTFAFSFLWGWGQVKQLYSGKDFLPQYHSKTRLSFCINKRVLGVRVPPSFEAQILVWVLKCGHAAAPGRQITVDRAAGWGQLPKNLEQTSSLSWASEPGRLRAPEVTVPRLQ